MAARSGASVKRIDVGRAAPRSDSASGAMICRTRSPNSLASVPASPLRVDRLVDDEPDVARIRGQPPLQHHVAAADDRERHDGQAGFERQVEAAALERRDAAVPAARAFGEHDERQPVRRQARRPGEDRSRDRAACGRRACARCAADASPETGMLPERLLGDDAQLKRQRPEEDRNVVDALVVGDEDVGAARLEPLEPA